MLNKKHKNCKKNIFILSFIVLLLCLSINAFTMGARPNPWNKKEGGYVGKHRTSRRVVLNFLQNFQYERFQLAYTADFTSLNDVHVDAMNFAYFRGSGKQPLKIKTWNGFVDLSTAGNTSHRGYGDGDLEFIVFHSSEVIPKPFRAASWMYPSGIFNGLRQALGFWKPTSNIRAPKISGSFGRFVSYNVPVWVSWWYSCMIIGKPSRNKNRGAVVLRSDAFMDRYYDLVRPTNNQKLIAIYF